MKRIRNLIDHVSLKPKEDEIQPAPFPVGTEIVKPVELPTNPMLDREIIESIDSAYYDVHTNVMDIELKKLPCNPSIELINEMRAKLHVQLNSVSKKLSDVILENQPSYQKELQRVRELQKILNVAFSTCNKGKNHLLSVTNRSNLHLLIHVQRRKNLASLHLALETIKTLQHTDVRLRELLDDEDYPEAIQLCLECQKAAVRYKEYNCIKDLYSKLQDTVEAIEEQIDVALSKICSKFDKKIYEKLQNGYKLLGKPQTAVDQLLMHFTSCIHNTAFQTVLGFIELSSKTPSNHLKKQFNELCCDIDISIYVPCLLALCKSLWNVMDCYYQVSKWHFEEFSSDDSCQVEFDRRYIMQKLKHGRHRVWLDVQSRIKTYLLGTDLSCFKYDDFILVLDIVKKMMSVGKDFCEVASQTDDVDPSQTSNSVHQSLHDPVYQQSLGYFHAYHQKCMDELHMFLENEAWEPCPMNSKFSLQQLPEFKFLLEANYYDIIRTPFEENPGNGSIRVEVSSFFQNDNEKYHPFLEFEAEEIGREHPMQHLEFNPGGGDSEDDDFADELLQDYVDEETDDHPRSSRDEQKKVQQGPILTNTAVNVMRICGKYLKMCDVLKPIAIDVIICMSNLFDYYLFTVFKFFVTQDESRPRCSEKLIAALQRIERDIIGHTPQFENGSENSNAVQDVKTAQIPPTFLSPIIDLGRKSDLYGFSHRITATESLTNLAKQFEILKPNLEKLIPSGKQAFLHQFFSQTLSTCPELCSLVYFEIAAKCIDYELVLGKMLQVKWEIRDIMSQHSQYVDELLHQFQLLKVGLSAAAKGLVVPDEISQLVWKHCILLANRTLVEGYSNVRKCSNEGRALMQLDFQQFLLKIDQLTKVRPVPGKEYVEGYIKAFYLMDEDLETWMNNHPEYSQKQLSTLVHCSAASSIGSSSKKNKQRMLSLIEDLTGRK